MSERLAPWPADDLDFHTAGECDVEYPKGHPKRRNDWRIVL